MYGDSYDMGKAEQFRQAALRGDYSWLPPIKFVSGETLGGGNGCFSAEDGCVYLNADLKDDPKLLASVYVEETGHFIDTKVNKNDAAGDEGELFRRILSGEHLTADTVAAIKAENDHGTIVVDGKVKEVEFWFGSDIVNGVKKAAKAVGGAVSDAAQCRGPCGRGRGQDRRQRRRRRRQERRLGRRHGADERRRRPGHGRHGHRRGALRFR